ncbi:Ceramide very long chain fatty acid hydroxylase SCS7 [Termitomyces sp. J132]|nr:Ceramide very long chain fatty acid hydroxylase SCS7 [Termitomyces sp. J132]
MSKRFIIYTAEDLAAHKTASSCWVSRQGKVYDVTSFLHDHPGGDDYILKYAGEDINIVMKDKDEHDHSDSAYEMLEEYVIGRLGTGATTVSDDWEATDDFHPDDTDEVQDFEKNQFLDLRKPLLRQVWEANWSKAYYLQQVHQPRHLAEPARFFGPDILEACAIILEKSNPNIITVWYVVPLFWGPIATRSALQWTVLLPSLAVQPVLPWKALYMIPTISYGKTLACFFVGNLIWTLLEYLFHRFLFHIDYLLPDHPAFLTLHFLMHGVHHYLPMDRLRLVMPPALFFTLQTPMTRLAHLLFPPAMANGIISGAFTFYILYDCMHYALHHTRLPAYLREMKKYHLAHHYKNFDLGFGVTSKIWDIVFNTLLPV